MLKKKVTKIKIVTGKKKLSESSAVSLPSRKAASRKVKRETAKRKIGESKFLAKRLFKNSGFKDRALNIPDREIKNPSPRISFAAIMNFFEIIIWGIKKIIPLNNSPRGNYDFAIFNGASRRILALPILVLVSFALSGTYSLVSAAPDKVLNYQGKLTDENDVVKADGNYSIKFTIWDAASNGNCLWSAQGSCGTPTAKTVTTLQGIFSTLLGEVGDNALTMDFNSNYWLQLQVGTDDPMIPRRQISVSGYAINSGTLDAKTWAAPGTIGSGTPNTGAFTTLDSNSTTNLSTGAGATFGIGNSTGEGTIASGGASSWTNTAGNLTLSTDTSGDIILSPAGNVGIGIAAPGSKLAVEADTTGTAASVFEVTDSSLNTLFKVSDDGTLVLTNDATYHTEVIRVSDSVRFAFQNAANTTLSRFTLYNNRFAFSSANPAAGLTTYQNIYAPPSDGSGAVVGEELLLNFSALNSVDDGYTGFLMDVTDALEGAEGPRNLMDLQVGSVSKFSVTSGGDITTAGMATVNGIANFNGTGNFYATGMSAFFADSIAIGVGATSAPLTVSGGTPADASGAHTLADFSADYSALATAGDSYTGIKLNVTDTTSPNVTPKLLMDLQVGSASQFSVSSTGNVAAGNQISLLEGGATPTYRTILKSADLTGADSTYTLPDAYPIASGRVLSSTDAGVMSWVEMSGATYTAGNYIDITANQIDFDPTELGTVTWFDGTAATDIVWTFDGETNDGTFGFYEDEDAFGITNSELGIGTTDPGAFLHVLGTTEQLRLGYDADSYVKFTTASDSKLTVETFEGTQSMITIGKGTNAQDAGISFDGNSNNYYLGMDDTTDKFMMGLGFVIGTTPYFTMENGGSIGIGLTDPTALLHLSGAAGTVSLEINSNETSTTNNVLALRSDVAAGDDLIFRVQANGLVYADGAYTGTGADYAEYFETKDSDLLPGEAVCLDPQKENAVKRCERSADNNLMGIISSHPSVIGNNAENRDQDPHFKIVAMLGQISGLVSTENGNIAIGDSLTSASVPGYLRKANPEESTVGVALQNFSADKGSIQILISRRNKSLTVEKVEEAVSQRIAEMNVEDQVNTLIADARSQLDKASETRFSGIEAELFGQKNLVAILQAQVAELQNKLNTETNLAQVDLNTQDAQFVKLILGTDRVTNPEDVDILGRLSAKTVATGGMEITIIDLEAPTIGEISVLPVVVDEDEDGVDDESGSDGQSAAVKTKAVTKDSKIFTNFEDNPNAFSWTEKTKEDSEYSGFEIKLSAPVEKEIKVNWWIVEAK